ncbi:MAG TPA: 3-dehydroquinate synthase [bacterium]|nr:3-dehydroquinate synthase [bacterium]
MTFRIDLSLGRNGYPIFVRAGMLKNPEKGLVRHFFPRKTAIVASKKIYRVHGRQLATWLSRQGIPVQKIFVNDSETRKNEKTLFAILRKMAEFGFNRDSGLVALGGGVIGDMTGLAASLYMRGIPYIQCPTTLLAQVDAGIGGKTAIDFCGTKNLIGAFYQPKAVLIDPDALKTLPQRQFISGLAEVVKYGVIRDENLFSFMEANKQPILSRDSKFLRYIIARSCAIKADVVSRDEREGGLRAVLNYGHTLGHALESYFEYEYLTHGEAISYGMWFAGLLSSSLGLCGQEIVDRQVKLLQSLGLFRALPKLDNNRLLKIMALDKKSKNGQVQFVLTRKIGLVNIRKNIPRSTILSALTRLQAEARELI